MAVIEPGSTAAEQLSSARPAWLTTVRWDGQPGDPQRPSCGGCKGHVIELIE